MGRNHSRTCLANTNQNKNQCYNARPKTFHIGMRSSKLYWRWNWTWNQVPILLLGYKLQNWVSYHFGNRGRHLVDTNIGHVQPWTHLIMHRAPCNSEVARKCSNLSNSKLSSHLLGMQVPQWWPLPHDMIK